MRMRGRGKKGLGNNYTLARAKDWNLQKMLKCNYKPQYERSKAKPWILNENHLTRRGTMELEAAIDTAAVTVGLTALKPLQREAIRSFTSGNDVFVSLPTGYGKSFCFVLLPLVFDRMLGRSGSIVLCISPLTSLMMEQQAKFTTLGLCCEFVGELQQDVESMSNVQKGLVQLLYISPESLLSNPQWREMLRLPVYQERMVALVIDEAHCIVTWYMTVTSII